ncbi:hypothetical protein ACFVAQ_35565 [Streptomyces sp. NPDC057651]|uniref:hypothetical protein n=1 Tax=Streptomyces sp. NPDC057651 TaxID=3346194 RepID=UPI003682345A
MTGYGFSIKALPKGGKPFGDDSEDEQGTPEGGELEGADPQATAGDPADDPAGPPPAAPADDPAVDTEAPAESPAPPTGSGEEPAVDAPPPPTDDAQPWAGDMYDEGDETDPDDALYGYSGTAGEKAWLDKAPDGTLTG